MSNLLIDEYPLIVLPTLATKIGLNEAIFLQQLNYWLGSSQHQHDGRKWVYNTFDEWQKQLPFWSVITIKRIVKGLRDQGIVIATSKYNKMPMDRTLWYSIDREALDCITKTPPLYQVDTIIVSDCYDTKCQVDTSNNQRLPETTTETTVDQGEGSKIVAAPPPTAAPVNGHRKMGSDDYDHPITATAAPPPVAAPPPKRTDGRKFVGGFIPAGKGTNPVEIWYESFSVQDQETRLTAPDEDDLRHCTDLAKLRNVIATFRKQGFKRKKNIQLILEWYRDGIPAKYIGESNERSYNGSGGVKRPVGTAQQPHPAMQWGTADPNDPF